MAHRFRMGREDFAPWWSEANFNRTFPRKPSRIFVNSMSDVGEWKSTWVRSVFNRIRERPDHQFLFLTKRPRDCDWFEYPNAILGISITNQESYDDLIRYVGPSNTFLSIEPLHGPIKLWTRHKWVIVGAETGNRKERITPDPGWIHDIYDFATDNGIPLFFKESLRSLWPFDGIDYFPQEYPK
jgi:protein gp37